MGCPVFDTACPTIPQLDSPKSSGFVCHLENVSSMYQTKLDWCFNQFQDALFSLCIWMCASCLKIRAPPKGWFPFLFTIIHRWLMMIPLCLSSIIWIWKHPHQLRLFSVWLLPLSFRILHPVCPTATAKDHLKLSLHVHILRYLAKHPKTMSVIANYLEGTFTCIWTPLKYHLVIINDGTSLYKYCNLQIYPGIHPLLHKSINETSTS